jgi:hypothetical protein
MELQWGCFESIHQTEKGHEPGGSGRLGVRVEVWEEVGLEEVCNGGDCQAVELEFVQLKIRNHNVQPCLTLGQLLPLLCCIRAFARNKGSLAQVWKDWKKTLCGLVFVKATE